jgi:hypothetical protein
MMAFFKRGWAGAGKLLHLGLLESGLLHSVMLRAAAMIVPAQQRVEWAREWRGELWHVRQTCSASDGSSWRDGHEATAFCMGAFQDALCLRRATRQRRLPHAALDGTARQCIVIFAAILAASYTVALLLPGVRAERSLWPRKVNPNLVLIEREGSNNGVRPTVSPAQFRAWQERRQTYFDGFAFYRVTREAVVQETTPGAARDKSAWGVARASSNLFALLDLPVRFSDPEMMTGDDLPAVILSEAVWKKQFGADPHVAGVLVRLGTREVRIAGVAPDGSLDLPGKVDAWLLEPNADNGSKAAGYVVAHLSPMGAAEMWAKRVHISATGPGDAEDDLLGVALEEWKPSSGSLYLFGLMLALLALPAITSVSLGEYSVNPQKTSWTGRLYRWSFLGAKVALLLPIVYFLSLDMAYSCTYLGREQAIYIQLISCFAMSLFGLRWVLKDQRQRCPVCVRRVVHPAQVGLASRTFLDWNGTEMMCMGGHTLLHVPALPTSWFSTQRWLYLDNSWGFLFAGSTRPIP